MTGLAPRLLIAFLCWSVVGWSLFPAYQAVLAPATGWLLDWLRPHEVAMQFESNFPWLRWSFSSDEFGRHEGRLSFLLLVYNTVLYLTVLSAIRLSKRRRVWLGLSAVPFIFAFHLFDLALTVESRILSVVQRQHYDFLVDFGFWFSLVKVYNFMSIMALKQVVLLGLLAAQYHAARRIWGDAVE